MSRGKKKEVIVIVGPMGNVIRHKFNNDPKNITKEKAVGRKIYDPVSRRHVLFSEVKVRSERHSS
jgi:hypothetical protein